MIKHLRQLLCSHFYTYKGFDRDDRPWVRRTCEYCGKTSEWQTALYVDESGSIRPNLTPQTIDKLLAKATSTKATLKKC